MVSYINGLRNDLSSIIMNTFPEEIQSAIQRGE